jgi:hypothetical protein
MRQILTKRRVAFVAVAGVAAGLVSTAAGAVRSGDSPGPVAALRAAPVGGWENTSPDPGSAPPVPDSSGVLSSLTSCVTANASRTVMTHSLDARRRSWVVHVARRLCSSLFVQDAQYRKPLQGGRDYPQRFVTAARLVRMQAPGTYRVPLVSRNPCVQTDTGASWGSPPRWPPVLARVGVTQPQQLSHWSRGPNTWYAAPPAACKPFLPPPRPTVSVHCPQNCTGIATVTVSARNPTTYAFLKVAPVVNGRVLTTRILGIRPGGSGSVSFSARDGDTITLRYVYPNSTHPPYRPVGRPVKVNCPPGAPPVAVTTVCPCVGDLSGTVQVTNASRFPLEVAVSVGGVPKAVVSVPPKRSGAVTLTLSRNATLTFGYRYNVTGHFPPTFTRIAFKVTTSA